MDVFDAARELQATLQGDRVFGDIVLPNLGFGMEEGKILSWLKKVGDPVRKGDAIAEIESDKTTVELEAVVDGVLDQILVPSDTVAAVGAVLARIRRTDAAAASTPVKKTADEPTAPGAGRATPVAQRLASEHDIKLDHVQGTGPGGRIISEDVRALIEKKTQPTPLATESSAANGRKPRALAAPAVRKLARDHGIDLLTIQGTGKDRHVTRADVESAIAVSTAPADKTPAIEPGLIPSGERTEIPLSQMRRAIARRLTQSAQEAPHFYVTAELDLSHALKALPDGINITNLLLYITIQTLKELPVLNATYEDGHLYQYANVNLSIATAVESGLISPVLHRADDYSLSGLAARVRDLITRAREKRLRPEELGGGTFTVSNLGVVQQVDRFTAILNPPQVGILAIGAAKDRPVVIDGGLHVRKTVHLTLSADHRVVDGMVVARFLEAFDNRLQAFAG